MSNSIPFSEFSRQSPKGIFVIYLNLIYKVIKAFWILLFIFVQRFSKISSTNTTYIYIGITVLLIFLLVRAYLIYINFQFKVSDNHFILKKGIFKKTNTAIPFYRIQNINFKQNIIQQIIGVFEVGIETAGSSKTEISIKALSLEKATTLKEIISKNTEFEKEVIAEETLKPLVKIDFLSLFKVSLTENHLQNLLLFFALAFGLFSQIQQLVDGLGKTENLDGFIEENTSAISASLFLVVTLLIVLILIALISSFVKIFLIHFNLTAYLKKDAFEINQGLFTKKSMLLKKQKVQNITISTNPLKRLIGISFITFKQAVSGKIKAKKKDKLIRIVGCRKDQVETIKASLFDYTEVEKNTKMYPDIYYKRRIYIFAFLFLTLGYIAVYFTFPFLEIFYSLFLVIPLVLLVIFKKVKKRFYKISESLLITGTGLLETHHMYLELFKVQNIKLKQTIFQKRSNVADLVFQTASGKIRIPCINYNEAIKIYNHTLFKVETSTKSWM